MNTKFLCLLVKLTVVLVFMHLFKTEQLSSLVDQQLAIMISQELTLVSTEVVATLNPFPVALKPNSESVLLV